MSAGVEPAEAFEGFGFGGVGFGALVCQECGALVYLDKMAAALHRMWHRGLQQHERGSE